MSVTEGLNTFSIETVVATKDELIDALKARGVGSRAAGSGSVCSVDPEEYLSVLATGVAFTGHLASSFLVGEPHAGVTSLGLL
jgi:hypothetical protein